MKKVLFIKNAAVLTATALILRVAGMVFKVWLAGAVGSEGIGLYQLVLSVYFLASAFAGSGICTAVTRLCADELAVGTGRGALSVLKKGIMLSLLVAALTLSFTFFGAEPIAAFIGDARAADALRIMGFSLPFMGMSSCLRGFFVAMRRTLSSGISQIIEQAVRIVVVVAVFATTTPSLSAAVAAVLFGDAVAEGASCLYMFLCLAVWKKKNRKTLCSGRALSGTRSIIRISLPITLGRYLNSGLRTAENIMVPNCLTRFGGGSALSQFGMIKGMALPLLFFPSSFLSSVSTLLLPEMSEAAARGNRLKIRFATERTLKLTLLSSYITAALFFALSDRLGRLVYNSAEVGFLLRALAPIVPLMYVDSVCDGMLKGLDLQGFVFRVTVSDSALRLLLIPFVVPRFGMTGFLLIMVASNIYTAFLRVGRLLRAAATPFDIGALALKPVLSAAAAVGGVFFLLKRLSLPDLPFTVLAVLLSFFIYVGLCLFFGCVSRDDVSL